MDKKKYIMYIIAVIILAIIPIYIISLNNDVLKNGTEYKFKVRGYDPYDMLRGNYINISFLEREVKENLEYNSEGGNDVDYFVKISKDAKGFAYFSSASKLKPAGSDYYKAKCGYNGSYDNITKTYKYNIYITTPTIYYMNQNKSQNAEKQYAKNTDNTYVKVRVKDGKMIIVGVYVNDILIDSIENS